MFRIRLEVPTFSPRLSSQLCLLVLLVTLAGCAGAPPTGWQSGGQPLVAPRARWVNGELLVDIDHEGRVYVSGRHTMTIDASGRVYTPENEPLALLQRDGHLLGPDDMPMGWVGAGEAILPGDTHSWLLMQPSGLMLRALDEDEAKPFGQWLGCSYNHTVQICTLVAHILGKEALASQGRGQGLGLMTPGIGLGSGFLTP